MGCVSHRAEQPGFRARSAPLWRIWCLPMRVSPGRPAPGTAQGYALFLLPQQSKTAPGPFLVTFHQLCQHNRLRGCTENQTGKLILVKDNFFFLFHKDLIQTCLLKDWCLHFIFLGPEPDYLSTLFNFSACWRQSNPSILPPMRVPQLPVAAPHLSW